MKYAYPIVGTCGLCNMLFKWANAVKYCHENSAVMLAPQWTNYLRLGPWLRRERDKRYYRNQFTNSGYVKGIRRFLVVLNPFAEKVIFSDFKNFFDDILSCHDLIEAELLKISNVQIIRNVERLSQKPFIGVHIRRGDFLRGDNVFPNEWYIRAIHYAVQKYFGGQKDIKILIFSDAEKGDLHDILSQFSASAFIQSESPLQDLLLLSRAKILIGTCNSTFSMWAVFLGQMPSIWGDRNHINGSKRRVYVADGIQPEIFA